MDILVYGAGVCGSWLASELFSAKCGVTLLARGKRLDYLRENGVTIRHVLQKKWTAEKVPLTDRLAYDACYDVVFVTVGKTDLPDVLSVLEANKVCPLYIFLGNNGDIRQVCRGFSDSSRLAFGYPACGGYMDKGIVYSRCSGTPVLTLGETLGRDSARLRGLAGLFRGTPVKVAVSPDIDGFLKYRLAILMPMAAAIRWADGDMAKLASSAEAVPLLAAAFAEGFHALEALGYPFETASVPRLLKTHGAPAAFAVRHLLSGATGALALRDLVLHAPGEMDALAADLRALINRSGAKTPSFDHLCALAAGTTKADAAKAPA